MNITGINCELKENLESNIQKSYEEIYGLQTLRQSLESIDISIQNNSYESIEIPENSVIYCDIPYKDTSEYKIKFDYDKFYDWCRNLKQTVYILEYQTPDDFIEVTRFQKTYSFSVNNKRETIEKLFKSR